MLTGPSKTLMLKTISGEFISFPPLSRSYPTITELSSQLSFLNFKDKSGLDTVHLSARYESYSYKGILEVNDDTNSVFNYITGLNNYNTTNKDIDSGYIEKLLTLFNLNHLSKKWINSLSNGQLRRARIAKSLMSKPKMLVIDDPFLGLDPSNTDKVSDALSKVNDHLNIAIVLGLRVQDDVPKWIKNVAYVDEEGLKDYKGKKEITTNKPTKLSPIDNNSHKKPIHIEFTNARVAYKDLVIFHDFDWKIPKGTKWRIVGDNGTGKTTLLSLITADHPQSWKSVLKINDKVRKTGSGITFFDVNNQIGMSSPELHALVPQHNKTMLDIIYNGLVPNIGNSNYIFKPNEKIDKLGILDKFKDRILANGNTEFVNLNMTDQKLALFLRALIKNPEILILDEAFSCMEDSDVMERCHKLLLDDKFKDLTILSIGHIDWELPKYDYMIKLVGDEDRNYEIYKVD
ncbi:hypothetical protein KGF54_002049 [Candida jiufengensis]|uniref:uncharacterized protein n=1 Tax=Candida jiufengensis TaxID=497108 RepID=UPI002224D805|nr:uncharacterized protein KGF54_002049 [Candida jiufengensis]KAI5954274.1 hypothetical protein KGF54_002049 [Candida jiufengensis]